ncbi:2-dehydropantoate 2-reductase [Bacillus sp. DTU_2020_1000418_1_SI_GHA_SEK_038]|uniref:ketopantoate reductase family protein n=1 Tax=Bacillus sp. DTU_2020_1000418_1_SI_GHA_SEK_038 TaxID=3077585 RepID=UPI0028E931A0|nr:2-dehydropantoate 2-reductase [Bacillus sp. DTU_2020_1000418_1_SI_GHA_SEK_038]WNS76673.1 2-dehydropantoate 2-reductase [Bacillus sp. DTU_2020_1000418_1_SI_GHA_SEK_038]
MNIAIMGAGSLGTIIGALMTEGGEKVDLIDININHVNMLNQLGATLSGFINKTISVNALTPNNINKTYDLVFLLTKQVYNYESLKQLLPYLHENSIVCTLQNGIPEDYVSSIVGAERTVGGVVGFGATWKGPGESELTTEWETVRKYAFDIGELTGEVTPRLSIIKSVLEHIGYCEISTNILGMKWSKLLMNATFSGMSAALGCTFGEVLDNKIAMTSLAFIADETIKVAHAQGIQLAKMQGKDMEFLELKDGQKVEEKMDFYHEVWSPHRNLKASMLQDLDRKVKTEINYINGYVSDKGKAFSILTPFNDLVVKLVSEAEDKKVTPVFSENLYSFELFNAKYQNKTTKLVKER